MQVTKHDPGTFCYIELATPDRKGAAKFYESLFGWKMKETPLPDGSTYVQPQKNGRDVGGMYETKDAPPNWLSYIAVASADDAAAKAESLGGHLMMKPFDVMDLGRMALVVDPQGAPFAVWQPKANPGVGVRDESGTLCWNELATRDVEAARKFYASLFGWAPKVSPEYTEWHVGSKAIGGLMKASAPEIPPHWLVYFMVDDVDASTKKAKSLGARTYVEPMDIPKVGRFSVVADPHGASFALFKPSM